MADFFADNLIYVFFFYGLAFFAMGLAVLLEIGHSTNLDFSKALIPLAGFGLIHGAHEWFEMGLIIHLRTTQQPEPDWVFIFRLVVLAISFMFLVAFGARLIIGPEKPARFWGMLAIVTIIWTVGLIFIFNADAPVRNQMISADVYTRYSLAIPGAALTFWGLLILSQKFVKTGMRPFAVDVIIAAIAFALYGGIGQLFVSPSIIFPSSYLNSEVFLHWVGFPIQGFRALMAIIAAIFIIHSLRAIEEHNQRRIRAMNETQKAEENRIQALRAELLHRTVEAQEQERLRIARELHDEIGQGMTALGLGLYSLRQIISTDPERAITIASQLQRLANDGLANLQNLVFGLRPPHLDELGLLPALRWYAQEMSKRFDIEIQVNGPSNGAEMPIELRLTIFRIAQEAITNAVRHAVANQVTLNLLRTETGICLSIEDDGQGYDVDRALNDPNRKCLGLLGMQERAGLVGGKCEFRSELGKGALVMVTIDYAKTDEDSNSTLVGG